MHSISSDLARWAPPPRKVRYARVGRAGDMELHRVIIEETWGELEESDGGVFVRRRSHKLASNDDAAERTLSEDALVGYTPEGFVDVGVFGADGALSRWSPAQVVLPPEPVAGQTWKAVHTRGRARSEREVTIRACTDHPRCLMSVAEVRRPDGVLVLRTHFVEEVGFGGFEAMVLAEGSPPVRMWTESLTVTRR